MVRAEQEAPGTVLTAVSRDGGGALLQMDSGAVWQYEAPSRLQPCAALPSFPKPCMQTWAAPADVVGSGGMPYAVCVVNARSVGRWGDLFGDWWAQGCAGPGLALNAVAESLRSCDIVHEIACQY